MRKVFFAVLALIVLCTAVAFATDGSVTNVKLSPVYVANAYIPTSAYLKSNDYISVSAVYNSTKGTYLWTYSFKPTGLNLYKAAGNTTPTSVANDIAVFTLSFLSPATSVIKAGTISVAGTTATVNTTGNDLTFNFGSNIYQNSGASISFETYSGWETKQLSNATATTSNFIPGTTYNVSFASSGMPVPTAVPEPAGLLILATGAVSLIGFKKLSR